jgi:hypothetical protein
LFPKLKFYLKGCHFGTVESIEKPVTDQLKAIPFSDFQRCYEECGGVQPHSQGDYFDGDKQDV